MAGHLTQRRTSFAAGELTPAVRPKTPHRGVLRAIAQVLRIAAVPAALLAASAAGVIYVVLLPVCGLVALAVTIGRVAWRRVRGIAHDGEHVRGARN